MKITKEELRRIIKEELLNEYGMETYQPGELVQITQSNDGYETNIEKVGSPDEYRNTRSAWTGVKMLVKVLQVAEDFEE